MIINQPISKYKGTHKVQNANRSTLVDFPTDLTIFANANKYWKPIKMHLRTMVYVRDISNLSDARYCAAMGVELLGFRLDVSKENALSAIQLKEISGWVSGVKLVGEFGESGPDIAREMLNIISLDFLSTDSTEHLLDFSELGVPLILRLDIDDLDNVELRRIREQVNNINYILLTSSDDHLDIGKESAIEQLVSLFPVILGFGINPKNAPYLAQELPIAGISVAGSIEARPGYKDYDDMGEILEALEIS